MMRLVASRQSDRFRRRHGQIMISQGIADPHRQHYRIRVSCDGGRTWGWHRATREELVEHMESLPAGAIAPRR